MNLSDENLNSTLAFLEKLPPAPSKTFSEGSVTEGKRSFTEYCAQCHRYNASGEKFFKSAPLVLFEGWYLKEQLRKFSAGLRGYHPDDERGQKMVKALDAPLEKVKHEDVIAYIMSLRINQP